VDVNYVVTRRRRWHSWLLQLIAKCAVKQVHTEIEIQYTVGLKLLDEGELDYGFAVDLLYSLLCVQSHNNAKNVEL